MRKWIVELLSKSQRRVIKIARVNSIRMNKSIKKEEKGKTVVGDKK